MRPTLPFVIRTALFVLLTSPVQGQHLRTGIASSQEDEVWTDLIRLEWYFDTPEGRVDSLITDRWDGDLTEWIHQGRLTNTYDGPELLRALEELWDADLEQWVLDEQNVISIVAGPTADTARLEQWDGSTWVPLSRRIFHQNAQVLTTDELGQIWNGTSYEDDVRNVYELDGDGNRTVNREDTLGMDWVTVTIDSSDYDLGGLKLEERHWSLQAGMMSLQTIETYQYNANDERVGILTATSIPGFGIFDLYRTELVPVGDKLSDEHHYLNTTLFAEPTWSYTSRLLYTDQPDGISRTSALDGFSLWPNPSTGPIELWNTGNNGYVQVCDLMGRVHYRTKIIGPGRHSMDLSMLAAGAYQVQVAQDGQVHSRPFIKVDR